MALKLGGSITYKTNSIVVINLALSADEIDALSER